MALIRADQQLEQVVFRFAGGVVTDIEIQVNYAIQDDVTGVQETRVRKTRSVWANLTPTQRTVANTLGQRLQVIALTP